MDCFFFSVSKDIDECGNHTCQNGGSCLDGVSNYSCNCLPGYTGSRCETGRYFAEFGREASLLCVAKSICYSLCFRFFSGSTISPLKYGNLFSPTDIDECVNHTCSNGGPCVDGVNNYSCNCKPGFTGDRCQTGLFFSFH